MINGGGHSSLKGEKRGGWVQAVRGKLRGLVVKGRLKLFRLTGGDLVYHQTQGHLEKQGCGNWVLNFTGRCGRKIGKVGLGLRMEIKKEIVEKVVSTEV